LKELTSKVMDLKILNKSEESNIVEVDENGLKIPKIYIDNLMILSEKYPEIFHEKAVFDEISTIIVAVFC
jgi:hypothetical protein